MSVVTFNDEWPSWRESQVICARSRARFANVWRRLWKVLFSCVGPTRGIPAATRQACLNSEASVAIAAWGSQETSSESESQPRGGTTPSAARMEVRQRPLTVPLRRGVGRLGHAVGSLRAERRAPLGSAFPGYASSPRLPRTALGRMATGFVPRPPTCRVGARPSTNGRNGAQLARTLRFTAAFHRVSVS